MLMVSHVTREECADVAEASKTMRDMMGPQAVDQFVRQAISYCWIMLPEGKKNVEAVEREIRRLVERALRDLKEDLTAFGIVESKSPGRKPRKS